MSAPRWQCVKHLFVAGAAALWRAGSEGQVQELSEQGGAFAGPAAGQKGLAAHGPGLGSLGPGGEQSGGREVVEGFLLIGVVDVTGNQKGDLKDLK